VRKCCAPPSTRTLIFVSFRISLLICDRDEAAPRPGHHGYDRMSDCRAPVVRTTNRIDTTAR
jgi:hypothetical protein